MATTPLPMTFATGEQLACFRLTHAGHTELRQKRRVGRPQVPDFEGFDLPATYVALRCIDCPALLIRRPSARR